jgi:hypothetical protein
MPIVYLIRNKRGRLPGLAERSEGTDLSQLKADGYRVVKVEEYEAFAAQIARARRKQANETQA